MPHHGNDEEHEREEPVSFQDKRRIDPLTGKVREQPGQAAAGGETPENAGAAEAAEGDALSQAEQILNEAGGDSADASDEGVTGAQDEELAGATAREEELRNDLLRVQAEFVNYKRRVERDRDVVKETTVQSVLTSLLPVLDDVDAARAAGDLTDGPFAAIAAKLDTVLTGLGLQRHDQEALAGQPFDPMHHEAVIRQPNAEVPEEHIVQVFRNGYVRGERVLRAAQVMVSAGEG
ncbi:nucleotide exchange factor GrpE [Citricoccus sp. I39-566]|uniref:nucleotide exchange factor GrpE n=1 Tax=Citricoccus sp. I39-566 TaxID=3073268 RepID=UPI00286A7564|nr:nucleotide exchange factor GrpE [Citricoccus sp. I39-566]WMY78359.1 nucleotide exchange factor GrpE [Citricoccus sp. I39-566]